MNTDKFSKYSATITCTAVKFDKSLIDGYACVKLGCGRFDVTCDECDWHTQTPFICINDKRYFIMHHEMFLECTCFEPDEPFYIVMYEGAPEFVSAEKFESIFSRKEL